MAEDTLFEFPTDFPIKIMGAATDEFRSLAIGIVTRHFGPLDRAASRSARAAAASTSGSRITVRAESKAQLDAVYTELTSCRQVLVAL